MDKKDGGTIDLESLRGFTPGPWRAGDEHGAAQLRPSIRILRDVTYVEGARPTTYVIGEATYPTTVGNTVGAEERRANAALIAAAPSMHAELLARRARDAEVEALVAAAHRAEVSFNTVRGCYERNPGNFMLAMNELEADVLPLRAALAAFTGATP